MVAHACEPSSPQEAKSEALKCEAHLLVIPGPAWATQPDTTSKTETSKKPNFILFF